MHLMKQKSIMQINTIINALLKEKKKPVRISNVKKTTPQTALQNSPHAQNYLKLQFTAAILKALLKLLKTMEDNARRQHINAQA